MKPILKSAIIFCLLFSCVQVNAQINPKKPVNNLGGQDLGIKTPKTKTKTSNNPVVNTKNAIEIHPVTSIKKHNTKTIQTQTAKHGKG